MSQLPDRIPKEPQLSPAEDFYRLRREGIGFIEQMGSREWTDYNIHDPGITILDQLCYAITDLAYRLGWKIEDILAPPQPTGDPAQPFPAQPFFTARTILTTNPWTPDDFRRLLIDRAGVRNAWLYCKDCACDLLHYYAWCEENELKLAYRPPDQDELQPVKAFARGLYEVVLELEADPDAGDLNNHLVEASYTVFDAEGRPHPVLLELRFPDWQLARQQAWRAFLDQGDQIDTIDVQLGAAKGYDLLSDGSLDAAGRRRYLRRHWGDLWYISLTIQLTGSAETFTIAPVTLRLFGDATARDGSEPAHWLDLLQDNSAAGTLQRYRQKMLRIEAVLDDARRSLHAHRNLDEDYCRISGVRIEEIAVCADVEVASDADIEAVQARIWYEIETYFNPPIRFYTLDELVAEGIAVEAIFNGPALTSGFLKNQELAAAQLRTVVRTSDIINRLMDIEGVMAVNQLLLTKYASDGQLIRGAADPLWVDGEPVFDANKSSAAWLLFLSDLHQPRLYRRRSRFLFFKDGLPFLPRLDEALDTLTQLHGEAERPRLGNAADDLPIPGGTYRDPLAYFPLQHGFPLTYGIGPEGLPPQVDDQRRAEARQLKAYLMVYEQLLGNGLAQLAHTADLFSLDTTVDRTYFSRLFSGADIADYEQIVSGLTPDTLDALGETAAEYRERRNRFLNHLLARFGEQFSEYAILLAKLRGQTPAQTRLIEDKIAFLKAYPDISHDRGRAFNYRVTPCDPDNTAGLKKRISLLLGFPDLQFVWAISGSFTITDFQLVDGNGSVWLGGTLNLSDSDENIATRRAYQLLIERMMRPEAYFIATVDGQYHLQLKSETNGLLGEHPQPFSAREAAQALLDELLAWASFHRAILVEHLLLRPKFPGDALYPACVDGPCKTCGDEDPYSFRLTFVMPGWTPPFDSNLEMRRFAERTIRRETPAHLLARICWTGNEGFLANPCEPIIGELADLLQARGLTLAGERPDDTAVCTCAEAVYHAFSEVFSDWYTDKSLTYWTGQALQAELQQLFDTAPQIADLDCSIVLVAELWTELKERMLRHFHYIALYGWQFERFEAAWCSWLEANAAFDWTRERLLERVEAILIESVQPEGNPTQAELSKAICACATTILQAYGSEFYDWMQANLQAGLEPDAFPPFSPAAIVLCSGFTFAADTTERLQDLLSDRYTAYSEVSYRLWVLMDRLRLLRSVYPGATLHDCDDGSDENPVRLGSTALGNYSMRQPRNHPGDAPDERSVPRDTGPPVSRKRKPPPGQP